MLSSFVGHLFKFMSLKKGEKDFVIMLIIFDVIYPQGESEKITFKLLQSG